MEQLLTHAFAHIDVVGEHVAQGHYDIIDPDGNIILPSLWDITVQPDWSVKQMLWPLPDPVDTTDQHDVHAGKPPSPPADMPPMDGDILNLDDILNTPVQKARKDKKKKKKRPEDPFEILEPHSRISRRPAANTKTTQVETITFDEPHPDVERIADYKSKDAKWEKTVADETDTDLRPTDADKMKVAQYYLEKWTAEA